MRAGEGNEGDRALGNWRWTEEGGMGRSQKTMTAGQDGAMVRGGFVLHSAIVWSSSLALEAESSSS